MEYSAETPGSFNDLIATLSGNKDVPLSLRWDAHSIVMMSVAIFIAVAAAVIVANRLS